MKATTSTRIRASRFLTHRYACRKLPDYLIKLVAFGIVVIAATVSLTNAMGDDTATNTTRKTLRLR